MPTIFSSRVPEFTFLLVEFDLPLLLPAIEVFRHSSHKIGKIESAVLKLSGFSFVEVLTWPLVSVLYAYAK